MTKYLLFILLAFTLLRPIYSQIAPERMKVSPVNPKMSPSRRNNLLNSNELVDPNLNIRHKATPKEEAPKPVPIPKPVISNFSEGRSTESVDLFSNQSLRAPRKEWFRDISGLRVFLDQGFTFGVGHKANHRLAWYGSFGYQFNPIFFIGGGQGYAISMNNKESYAPTFANIRINFLDENTTPYFDLKSGYSFIQGQGFFFSPAFGVSFAKNKKAFNIGAGYVFQGIRVKKENVKDKYHGVSVRLTYEFKVGR